MVQQTDADNNNTKIVKQPTPTLKSAMAGKKVTPKHVAFTEVCPIV